MDDSDNQKPDSYPGLAEYIIMVNDDMKAVGFADRSYEEWLGEFVDRFGDTPIAQLLTPKFLTNMAYGCGVHKADDPLAQAWLEGYAFYDEHKGQDWFDQAIRLYEGMDYLNSARVFVNHGINYAYCCKGLQNGCPLHKAIHQAGLQRN